MNLPRKSGVLALVLALATLLGQPATQAPAAMSMGNSPTLPIEQEYSADGRWHVTHTQESGYELWYPSDLGRDGYRHPIITWGNGTNATPGQYAYLLAHFASWGFVVVAAPDTNTGSGVQIADAARWMRAQNDRSGSVFYHHLDPDRIGAAGHSQGASGALNALTSAPDVISTALAIELPSQVFCLTTPDRCADTRRINRGSIFLVNGSADTVISPSVQPLPWQLTGLQSNSAYYDAAAVTKAWATLNGPNHNDVQGQPGCEQASQPCTYGVTGYLGYPTAWFAYQLQGDRHAGQAFVNQTGEIFKESTNWSNQHSTVGSSAS